MARRVTDEERERARRGGEWLRQERERRGYSTGTEFAAALGIRQGRLSSYENGNYLVEVEIARRIAEVFGLPEKLVWHFLGLPMPAEDSRDAAMIAWAWQKDAEAMERMPGRKGPRPAGVDGGKSTRVTRKGGKPLNASPGEENAV